MVVCGGRDSREAVIMRLVEPAAEGRPIAVLRVVAGIFSLSDSSPAPHVVMRRVPIGCLCCTASVMFRAAVLGLLRDSHPARLVVDLGMGEHVAVLEAQLQRDSLARVLRLVGRVDVDAVGDTPALAWPADLHRQ